MKIAISATGDNWQDFTDTRFGRAKGFFIIDTDTAETSYIDNASNLEAAHGAGTSTSQALISKGVEIVITETVGPKAGEVLKSGGVKVFGGAGKVTLKEAYENYKKGLLKEQEL